MVFLEDILIPFVVISLAEFGDKTQLAVLLLSTKTKKHLQLLLGIILAFLIVDGIAVLFGTIILKIFPENLLKIIAGTIFIIFGIFILRSKNSYAEKTKYFKSPFLSGFVFIFLAEWGDKTQISAGLFAAKYNPAMVLVGVVLGMGVLSILAVYTGKFISEKIDRKLITTVAGIAFIIIGISFFFF